MIAKLSILLSMFNPAESAHAGDCSICLEDFDDRPSILTSCNHRFHERCLLSWIRRRGTCPYCRTQLVDADISDEEPEVVELPPRLARFGLSAKEKNICVAVLVISLAAQYSADFTYSKVPSRLAIVSCKKFGRCEPVEGFALHGVQFRRNLNAALLSAVYSAGLLAISLSIDLASNWKKIWTRIRLPRRMVLLHCSLLDKLHAIIGNRDQAKALLSYLEENGALVLMIILSTYLSSTNFNRPAHLIVRNVPLVLTRISSAAILTVNHSELIGEVVSATAAVLAVFGFSASATIIALVLAGYPVLVLGD